MASKRVDTKAPKSRSAIESALDRAIAGYARHMLVGERTNPTFSARLDGAHVLVDVHAPDGVQHFQRRASAYVRLCADICGRAQAAAERALWPSLVATISEYPDGGSVVWSKVHELLTDMDWVCGLEAIAQALLDDGGPGARDEAILLLRRLYEVDDRGAEHGLYVRLSPRAAPPSIDKEVKARSTVMLQEGSKSSTPQAMAKRVVPFAGAKEASERLAVAAGIEQALPYLSLSNHLSFFALVEKALPDLMKEGDGAVHEVAIGLAQSLAMKLLYRGAYAEAKKLLDMVVDHHVALPESLRARWECRLYLDACAGAADLDAAEEDWKRAAVLDEPTDPSPLGRCIFWKGDVSDRRRVALSRVAEGLAARAEGGDPCKDRRISKKTLPSAEEKARILARAAVLTGDVIEQGSERVAQDLKQARTDGAVTARGFEADEYAARASVREASGDREGALADYEAARELRIAAGLAWQIDSFGEDIRRLRRALAGGEKPGRIPLSFDPTWFLDATRTSPEREAAAKTWFAQPWRTFPESPSAARGRPFAYIVLREVLRSSDSLWNLAAQDGIDLGDRVAFGKRALAYLDDWFDRRDATWLQKVLEKAVEVAFLGKSCNLELKSSEERKALMAWLRELAKANPIDEEAILGGLKGTPWLNLKFCFDEHVDSYDPGRDLFDAVRRTGADGDVVAVVLAAYSDLFGNDWSSLGMPRGAAAKWGHHGKALAKLDASKLAPALIAWSRAHRTTTGGYFMAKWLWPLRYVWSEKHCAPFVEEVRKGRVDGGRSLSTKQKAARAECLAWLSETKGTSDKKPSRTTKL